MQPGHRWLGVAAGLLAAGLISGSVCGGAQAQAALTGVVSSSDEGPMEGVLVSAKKEGSSITTTVVSGQQGAGRGDHAFRHLEAFDAGFRAQHGGGGVVDHFEGGQVGSHRGYATTRANPADVTVS